MQNNEEKYDIVIKASRSHFEKTWIEGQRGVL